MSPTAAPPRPRLETPTPQRPRRTGTLLGAYELEGSARQVIAMTRPDGATLVIDLLAGSHADPRLVGHLYPDEPAENARILAGLYLADPRRGCRRLARRDLQPQANTVLSDEKPVDEQQLLLDRDGRVYRVREIPGRDEFPELRWTCTSEHEDHFDTLSVREVVGRLEAYEPARGITAAVLASHAADRLVSTCRLSAELKRLSNSPIVLNRGLREAVLADLRRGEVSMSEIAIRCGRIKHHADGNISGETSWLARRIGETPEAGTNEPTPWVHTDVLALIARDGLGIAPREVELG